MPFFLMSIETIIMCLIKRKPMSFHFTANMTTELSWLMRGFPYKIRSIHCQTISFRRWRSILLKILKKVSLNSARFFILCQYYLFWKQIGIFNSVLIIKDLTSSWNTITTLYYSLMRCLHKFWTVNIWPVWISLLHSTSFKCIQIVKTSSFL